MNFKQVFQWTTGYLLQTSITLVISLILINMLSKLP